MNTTTKYPWLDLADGDSFSVETNTPEHRKKMRDYMRTYGRLWCRNNRQDLRPSVRFIEGVLRVTLVPR